MLVQVKEIGIPGNSDGLCRSSGAEGQHIQGWDMFSLFFPAKLSVCEQEALGWLPGVCRSLESKAGWERPSFISQGMESLVAPCSGLLQPEEGQGQVTAVCRPCWTSLGLMWKGRRVCRQQLCRMIWKQVLGANF